MAKIASDNSLKGAFQGSLAHFPRVFRAHTSAPFGRVTRALNGEPSPTSDFRGNRLGKRQDGIVQECEPLETRFSHDVAVLDTGKPFSRQDEFRFQRYYHAGFQDMRGPFADDG